MQAELDTGETYRPITADAEKKLHYICRMLNFCLIQNGQRYGIRHVFGITKDMLEEFFTIMRWKKRAMEVTKEVTA